MKAHPENSLVSYNRTPEGGWRGEARTVISEERAIGNLWRFLWDPHPLFLNVLAWPHFKSRIPWIRIWHVCWRKIVIIAWRAGRITFLVPPSNKSAYDRRKVHLKLIPQQLVWDSNVLKQEYYKIWWTFEGTLDAGDNPLLTARLCRRRAASALPPDNGLRWQQILAVFSIQHIFALATISLTRSRIPQNS